jgi:signal transduction histidine kinase
MVEVFIRRGWPALVAAALIGLAFVPGIERQGVDVAELPDRPLDALGIVLIFALGAPIALLLRWPAVALTITGAAFCAYELLRYPTTFAALGMLVAVVGAAALLARFRVLTAALGLVVYMMLAASLTAMGSPASWLDFSMFGLVLIALWAFGSWMRVRSRAAVERRARDEREIVAAERARIARDMHDVVTHHVTAMVVQADAAQFTIDDRARSVTSLERIGDAGRAALADLRLMLAALDGAPDQNAPGQNAPDQNAPDQNAPSHGREPTPADLSDVVERARATGQPVSLDEHGTPQAMTGAARLVIIRVVQESLTNALKHATGSDTRVRIEYRKTEVEVEITTEASVKQGIGTGSGRGLVGLRERVELAGGEFRAGAVAHGFSVYARVPL